MPRQIDSTPGNLVVNHNPLTQLSVTADQITQLFSNPVKATVEAIEMWVNEVLAAIDQVTGLDLQALADALESIDFSSPEAFFSSFLAALISLGGMLASDVQGIIDAILKALGFPPGSGTLTDIENFFGNLLKMLGLPNLATAVFDIVGAITTFITTILKPTNLIAMLVHDAETSGGVTGFIPLENLAMDAIAAVVGGAQQLIDAILSAVGFPPGSGLASDVDNLFTNLLAMLGNPNLLAGFDPIKAAEQALQNTFTPAGALSTFTQIPAHLFAHLAPGAASSNLLPDPGFDDATALFGQSTWTWSTDGRTKAGSVWTVMAGVQSQLVGVPIAAAASDVISLGVYTKWTGVTAAAGTAIVLACNAYTAAGALIADPTNRIVAAITAPTTNSTTYTGADANGWVGLAGGYQTPAGTAYVRICLEAENTIRAGNVGFDDTSLTQTGGILDAAILKNIENIPQLLASSVQGFQGLQDIESTFAHMFDGMASALGLTPVSGTSTSQTFSLAQQVAQAAALAQQILGIRNNKPTASGADPTSEAMISLGHFSVAGALQSTSVAAGNALGQTFRAAEAAVKGFVEFLASGSSVTNIFVNVYAVNPTTHAKTALWNSSNIASLITSTMGYIKVAIPPGVQPSINAGDNLLIEIVNNGSAALSVVSKNTGLPNHPSDFPPNKATTRSIAGTGGASPATLTDAQVTYSATAPYINFGMSSTPAGYTPIQRQDFPSSGIYTLPTAGKVNGVLYDLIGLGGGGGGGSAQGIVKGGGAQNGNWNETTYVYGADVNATGFPVIPTGTTTLTVTLGAAGTPGAASFGGGSNGGPGGNTTITGTGVPTLTATGGAGGTAGGGGTPGASPGAITYNGVQYFGGSAVGLGQNGSAPGGGGGGGDGFSGGANGAAGFASITARQP
jgi:hypothetical protein